MEKKYLIIIIAVLILLLSCAAISVVMLGGTAAFFMLSNITKSGNVSSPVVNNTCCPAFPSNMQQGQDYRIIKFRSDLSMKPAGSKNQVHFYSITYLDLVDMYYVHFLYNDSQSLVDTVVYVNGTYYKSATVNGVCSAAAARADFYGPLSQDSDMNDLGMFLTIEALRNSSGGYIPPVYGQQIKQIGPDTYAIVMGPHSPYSFVFKKYNEFYFGDNITIYGNGTLNYAYSGVNPISGQDFNLVLGNEVLRLKLCKFTY